jgi:hypothetical protein
LGRNFCDHDTKLRSSLPAVHRARLISGFADELERQRKKILLRENLCAQANLFLDSSETID